MLVHVFTWGSSGPLDFPINFPYICCSVISRWVMRCRWTSPPFYMQPVVWLQANTDTRASSTETSINNTWKLDKAEVCAPFNTTFTGPLWVQLQQAGSCLARADTLPESPRGYTKQEAGFAAIQTIYSPQISNIAKGMDQLPWICLLFSWLNYTQPELSLSFARPVTLYI